MNCEVNRRVRIRRAHRNLDRSANMPQIGNGTLQVKYYPVHSSFFRSDGENEGVVDAQIQCITAMEYYRNYSLEELRWDDYKIRAFRAGPSAATKELQSTSVLNRPVLDLSGSRQSSPFNAIPSLGETSRKDRRDSWPLTYSPVSPLRRTCLVPVRRSLPPNGSNHGSSPFSLARSSPRLCGLTVNTPVRANELIQESLSLIKNDALGSANEPYLSSATESTRTSDGRPSLAFDNDTIVRPSSCDEPTSDPSQNGLIHCVTESRLGLPFSSRAEVQSKAVSAQCPIPPPIPFDDDTIVKQSICDQPTSDPSQNDLVRSRVTESRLQQGLVFPSRALGVPSEATTGLFSPVKHIAQIVSNAVSSQSPKPPSGQSLACDNDTIAKLSSRDQPTSDPSQNDLVRNHVTDSRALEVPSGANTEVFSPSELIAQTVSKVVSSRSPKPPSRASLACDNDTIVKLSSRDQPTSDPSQNDLVRSRVTESRLPLGLLYPSRALDGSIQNSSEATTKLFTLGKLPAQSLSKSSVSSQRLKPSPRNRELRTSQADHRESIPISDAHPDAKPAASMKAHTRGLTPKVSGNHGHGGCGSSSDCVDREAISEVLGQGVSRLTDLQRSLCDLFSEDASSETLSWHIAFELQTSQDFKFYEQMAGDVLCLAVNNRELMTKKLMELFRQNGKGNSQMYDAIVQTLNDEFRFVSRLKLLMLKRLVEVRGGDTYRSGPGDNTPRSSSGETQASSFTDSGARPKSAIRSCVIEDDGTVSDAEIQDRAPDGRVAMLPEDKDDVLLFSEPGKLFRFAVQPGSQYVEKWTERGEGMVNVYENAAAKQAKVVVYHWSSRRAHSVVVVRPSMKARFSFSEDGRTVKFTGLDASDRRKSMGYFQIRFKDSDAAKELRHVLQLMPFLNVPHDVPGSVCCVDIRFNSLRIHNEFRPENKSDVPASDSPKLADVPRLDGISETRRSSLLRESGDCDRGSPKCISIDVRSADDLRCSPIETGLAVVTLTDFNRATKSCSKVETPKFEDFFAKKSAATLMPKVDDLASTKSTRYEDGRVSRCCDVISRPDTATVQPYGFVFSGLRESACSCDSAVVGCLDRQNVSLQGNENTGCHDNAVVGFYDSQDVSLHGNENTGCHDNAVVGCHDRQDVSLHGNEDTGRHGNRAVLDSSGTDESESDDEAAHHRGYASTHHHDDAVSLHGNKDTGRLDNRSVLDSSGIDESESDDEAANIIGYVSTHHHDDAVELLHSNGIEGCHGHADCPCDIVKAFATLNSVCDAVKYDDASNVIETVATEDGQCRRKVSDTRQEDGIMGGKEVEHCTNDVDTADGDYRCEESPGVIETDGEERYLGKKSVNDADGAGRCDKMKDVIEDDGEERSEEGKGVIESDVERCEERKRVIEADVEQTCEVTKDVNDGNIEEGKHLVETYGEEQCEGSEHVIEVDSEGCELTKVLIKADEERCEEKKGVVEACGEICKETEDMTEAVWEENKGVFEADGEICEDVIRADDERCEEKNGVTEADEDDKHGQKNEADVVESCDELKDVLEIDEDGGRVRLLSTDEQVESSDFTFLDLSEITEMQAGLTLIKRNRLSKGRQSEAGDTFGDTSLEVILSWSHTGSPAEMPNSFGGLPFDVNFLATENVKRSAMKTYAELINISELPPSSIPELRDETAAHKVSEQNRKEGEFKDIGRDINDGIFEDIQHDDICGQFEDIKQEHISENVEDFKQDHISGKCEASMPDDFGGKLEDLKQEDKVGKFEEAKGDEIEGTAGGKECGDCENKVENLFQTGGIRRRVTMI